MTIESRLKDVLEKQGEADAIRELLTVVSENGTGLAEVKSLVDGLTAKGEAWEGLDPKAIQEGMEATKAQLDSLGEAVKAGRLFGQGSVPGLEGEVEKFSLTKLCFALKEAKQVGSEEAREALIKERAPFEHEVMKLSREHMAKASQTVSLPDDGGYFVPFQVIADVIEQVFAKSVLISIDGNGDPTRVNVIDGLTGQQVNVPRFNGGVAAYWMGEEDEYAESMAKVGDETMTPHKLGVLVRMSRELRQGASYGFERMLRRDMTRAIALKLDNAILYGVGTKNVPRGIVNNEGIRRYSCWDESFYAGDNAGPATEGGVFDFDDAINMMGHLEDNNLPADDSFAFISAPRTWRELRKLKIDNFENQSENQPYLLGLPTLTNAELRDLLGADFDATTQISTLLKAGESAGWTPGGTGTQAIHTDIFGANWSEVVAGIWGGITIDEDQGLSNFTRDQFAMKMRMYADTMVRYDNAVIWTPDARVRPAS